MLYEHDSLTGATTRSAILPTLKEQQGLMQRGVQSDCCIAMMDLDNFKKINDSFGHSAGDHVLSSVIKYVIEQLRPYDKVFRYGGEKFMILMKGGKGLFNQMRRASAIGAEIKWQSHASGTCLILQLPITRQPSQIAHD